MNTKLKIHILLLVGLSFWGSPSVFSQSEVLGKWWNPKKDAIITVYQKGSQYFGKISWAENPRKDTQNPDPSLRKKALVGMDIMQNFTWNNSEKEWIDGEIYDPNNGKTYSSLMWLEGNKSDKLKVRGYVMGMTFLGRTETFTRVEE